MCCRGCRFSLLKEHRPRSFFKVSTAAENSQTENKLKRYQNTAEILWKYWKSFRASQPVSQKVSQQPANEPESSGWKVVRSHFSISDSLWKLKSIWPSPMAFLRTVCRFSKFRVPKVAICSSYHPVSRFCFRHICD